ncbi:MAG: FAD-binding protein [Deltaproteobacteria bacterium]|nr:FAD-binding protein [Deltaproteobacteria bacterium]
MPSKNEFDYDYIVIGSGFGGSVSALRLSEKGYKVAVLEKGKQWQKKISPRPIGIRKNTCGCLNWVATVTRC